MVTDHRPLAYRQTNENGRRADDRYHRPYRYRRTHTMEPTGYTDDNSTPTDRAERARDEARDEARGYLDEVFDAQWPTTASPSYHAGRNYALDIACDEPRTYLR